MELEYKILKAELQGNAFKIFVLMDDKQGNPTVRSFGLSKESYEDGSWEYDLKKLIAEDIVGHEEIKALANKKIKISIE